MMRGEDENGEINVLWRLPCLSQEFSEGPIAKVSLNGMILAYDRESKTGEYVWDEVRFSGVVAMAFTSYESCTVEHTDAYDMLIEVAESRWLAELQGGRTEPVNELRHMRIFFDEYGCFDIAALDFEPPA